MRFNRRQLLPVASLFAVALSLCGCPREQSNPVLPMTSLNNALSAVDLSQPTEPLSTSAQATVSVARNSCCSFVVRVDSALVPAQPMLRLNPLNSKGDASSAISAYEVLSVPVNLDDAGFVRQTGQPGSTKLIPRVLLPLPVNAGLVDLSAAHDPTHPASVGIHPQSGPVLIWIDIRTASDTLAGSTTATAI